METWPSGRRQLLAKESNVLNRSVSSNLTVSASFLKEVKMKPNKTFNLSKQTKRFMCTILDPQERAAYKRAMIQAQLASEVVVKHKERSDRPQGTANFVTNETGTASTQA